jgi:cell division protease FtsH
MKTETKLDLWVYFGIIAAGTIAGLCYSPPLVPSANVPPAYHGRTTHRAPALSAPAAQLPASRLTATASSTVDQGVVPTSAAPKPDHSCLISYSMGYSQLRQCMDASYITSITAINGENEVIASTRDGRDFEVNLPNDGAKEVVSERAIALNIPFEARSAPFNLFTYLFSNPLIIGIALMIGMSWYFNKRQLKMQSKGTSKHDNFTKTKAKDYKTLRQGQKKLTFDDLRGCDEAKDHGKLLIEMDEHAPVFKAHKAPLPRGYLLVGPGGVGKTLFVRTIADELDGEVFLTVGSDFNEMFVGVGAGRARDLFDGARAKAKVSKKPVIIFIDEIDACGAVRGKGSDERDNTLNQLLVEMDGMLELENIIIIGATNRPDILDPALLRRLAHRIVMDKPDLKGRGEILDLYVRGLILGADVSVPVMAMRTWDFSGDQLKKSVDYAVTLAAKRCLAYRKENKIHRNAIVEPFPVTMKDFDCAFDFIQYGDELPSKQKGLSKANKHQTALHEACHAAAALCLATQGWVDAVVKATIMRRSRTLGFVMTMPQEERTNWNHRECLARIIMLMAGRAGQEVFLNTRDSGASGDFQMATDMAREMVMKWSMTDKIGHISIGSRSDGSNVQVGVGLLAKIDREWVELCNTCMDVARQLVKAEVKRIKVLTMVLEAKETILEDEIKRIAAAVPSNFDPTTLPMFGNLAAFEVNMFDSCEVLPVEEYIDLTSAASKVTTAAESDRPSDLEVENAIATGNPIDANNDGLETGAMA